MSINVVAKPENGAAGIREQGSHEVTVFFLESSKRVLWIEADKKFVDILLNFLLLPVGAAVQAISRGDPPLKPLGALGNIFRNIEFPGMQGETPTSEVKGKLLSPPPVLSNLTRLENAYACATMSFRKECRSCGIGSWYWELLWDHQITFNNCKTGLPAYYPCSTENKGLSGIRSLHDMAGWHTYIVTDTLEVHPSSVAKGMDLLRGERGQVMKEKRVVGSAEVLQLLRASLISASPLNAVFKWNGALTET